MEDEYEGELSSTKVRVTPAEQHILRGNSKRGSIIWYR